MELIRLYGIDCPELAQRPYGDKARQRLQQLLQPYEEIEIIEIDRDRTIADWGGLGRRWLHQHTDAL
ncbi:MAG: hypothetical protein HC886_04310 [Leptolyngbyaceae cyanobacterium SM1_1_3]|nr:hypothetical protein [Leptolyngbyaceae cyanobacterium SM1_1_3]